MMRFFGTLIIVSFVTTFLFAQSDTLNKIPFDGIDISWINGQNR